MPPAMRRPTPLSAEVCEGYVPTLLGRTSNSVPTGVLKKPIGPDASNSAPRLLTPVSTLIPEEPSSQGLGLPTQWAFTPMATPSPWGARQNSLFHRDSGLVSLLGPAGAPPAGYYESEGLVKEPYQDDDDADHEQMQTQGKVTDEQIRNAPRPPPGAMHPSKGSEEHYLGTCRRCCFFPRGRCANGYECTFCHYEHDKRKRKTRKGKRMNDPPSPVHQPLRRDAAFPPGTFTSQGAPTTTTTTTTLTAAALSAPTAPAPIMNPIPVQAPGPCLDYLMQQQMQPPLVPPMQPAMPPPMPTAQGLGLLSTTIPLCKVWGSR